MIGFIGLGNIGAPMARRLLDRPDELVVLDRLSQQYIGRPFPRRKWSARVVYVIEAHVARYYRSPLEHTPG